jgi:hypothetical protein
MELTFEYYDGAFGNTSSAEKFNTSLVTVKSSSEVRTTVFDCNLLQQYNNSYVALPVEIFEGQIPENVFENCSDLVRTLMEDDKALFSSGEGCADISRQPDEYRTAFFTNLTCIAVPLLIFYVMCARELLVRLCKLEDQVKERISNECLFVFVKMIGRILWLVLVSPLCCPFFILYIAVRQVKFYFHSIK